MQQIQYKDFVKALAKKGDAILATLTPEKADLLHMAVGLAGEGGEMLDAVKKHVIYNKPLDVENVLEECGDALFYIQGILNNVGYTMEDAFQHNFNKLSERYKGLVYSDQAAQDRADKQNG